MTDHDLIVLAYVAAFLWLTAYAARAIRRWSDTHSRDVVYLAIAMRVAAIKRVFDQALDEAEAWAKREAAR